jgi:hypothetical protein
VFLIKGGAVKFNKEAVQKQLDLAAEALDNQGLSDLADKVDYLNDKLFNVSSKKEFDLIKKGLANIERTARDRVKKKSEEDTEEKKLDVLKARRLAEKKKALLQRVQKNVDAKRKIQNRSKKVKELIEKRAKDRRINKLKEQINKKSLREKREKRIKE